MADYRAYVDRQEEVNRAFQDGVRWTRMSRMNTARIGKFSSDRAIHEYARKIWNLSSGRGWANIRLVVPFSHRVDFTAPQIGCSPSGN